MQDLLNDIGHITDLKSGQSFSPEKIHQQIKFYADYFQKNLQIVPGDRVVLKHGNSAIFFFTYLLFGGLRLRFCQF